MSLIINSHHTYVFYTFFSPCAFLCLIRSKWILVEFILITKNKRMFYAFTRCVFKFASFVQCSCQYNDIFPNNYSGLSTWPMQGKFPKQSLFTSMWFWVTFPLIQMFNVAKIIFWKKFTKSSYTYYPIFS